MHTSSLERKQKGREAENQERKGAKAGKGEEGSIWQEGASPADNDLSVIVGHPLSLRDSTLKAFRSGDDHFVFKKDAPGCEYTHTHTHKQNFQMISRSSTNLPQLVCGSRLRT